MGRIKTLFLGSPIRIAITAVFALAVVTAVVLGAGIATGVFGAPNVVGIDNRFGAVNETATIIETDIHVDNPNPIGINVGGVSAAYTVSMNDVAMASGTKEGLSVDTGESTVSLRTRMENERIPDWWVTHVENGEETAVVVDGTVNSSLLGQSVGIPEVDRTVSTDIESALDSSETRPINASTPQASDPVLYLNETRGSWGAVNDSATEIEMEFVVYNPKSHAVPVSKLSYNMTMNGVAVGSGESENTTVIEPGTTETRRTTTIMQNEKLDEWWVSHLENDQVTDLRIAFAAVIDLEEAGADPEVVDEPIGAVEVPLDTVEHRFETDVFGNKNESTA
jgi:LEA14-like dessication related protein